MLIRILKLITIILFLFQFFYIYFKWINFKSIQINNSFFNFMHICWNIASKSKQNFKDTN